MYLPDWIFLSNYVRELILLLLDNYEAIFARIFDALIPEDISLTDPEWHDDLAKLSPEGTVQVAYFEDVIESWTSWVKNLTTMSTRCLSKRISIFYLK